VIVTSPTDTWVKRDVADCRKSFAVSSPYIGDYFSRLCSCLERGVRLTVLTRTTLPEFAARSSDIDAVIKLAKLAGGVLSLNSLHAKAYIVDDRRALITSANATHSGMHRNWECGYQIRDNKKVRALRQLLLRGFGSKPRPQLWTVDDLTEIREPIERLRAALPRLTLLSSADLGTPLRLELSRKEYLRFIQGFSGWLQLTLDGISRIRSETFSMSDVFANCSPLARERFPNNYHVREKLRQQMQRLRDLGIVLFVGRGLYKLITEPVN